MEPDERAIREMHSTWIDAVNAGDLVCLLSSMADDVVFLSPGQAPCGRLTVFRKQPDGRWLLARDANTLSPAANQGS